MSTATAKNNDKPKAADAKKEEPGFELPKGYVQESTDVVGFWVGEKKRPIHGVPLFVNLSDSDIDESKPSALLFIRLVDPCKVCPADGEGKMKDREEIEAKPGDIVGVWFSAGMKDIAMAAGRKTFMVFTGEKDVGKPSKLKVYKVLCEKGEPKRIPVREDRRSESAGTNAAPFAGRKKVDNVDRGDASSDDMPF